MSATKTIRMIKPWGLHVTGAVLTLDASIANELIRCGRAKEEAQTALQKPEGQKSEGKKKKWQS